MQSSHPHNKRTQQGGHSLSKLTRSLNVPLSISSIIDSLLSHYIQGIAAARSLSQEDTRNIILNGPYFAETAKQLGLIDDVVPSVEEAEKSVVPSDQPVVSLSRYNFSRLAAEKKARSGGLAGMFKVYVCVYVCIERSISIRQALDYFITSTNVVLIHICWPFMSCCCCICICIYVCALWL